MKSARAFTLVELLTAVGLIAVLALGITTLFHREGNAGVALRAAQRELGSALALARTMALARQVPVRLCVTPGGPGDAGRRWWLMRAEGAVWVGSREAGELPAGTCVVPANPAELRVRAGMAWRSGLLSQLDGPVPGDGGMVHYVEFCPDGSVAGGTRRILVATADEVPGQAALLVGAASVRATEIRSDGRIDEVTP